MDDCEHGEDWRDRLRDELLPYTAFYALGLVWLSTVGMVGAWSDGGSIALVAMTGIFGIPVCALVSLMLVWRMFMFGIDANRIVPMVVAVSSALSIIMVAVAAAYPAYSMGEALGHLHGSLLRAIVG